MLGWQEIIGTSLNEPYASVTTLHTCVCMLVCLDWPCTYFSFWLLVLCIIEAREKSGLYGWKLQGSSSKDSENLSSCIEWTPVYICGYGAFYKIPQWGWSAQFGKPLDIVVHLDSNSPEPLGFLDLTVSAFILRLLHKWVWYFHEPKMQPNRCNKKFIIHYHSSIMSLFTQSTE